MSGSGFFFPLLDKLQCFHRRLDVPSLCIIIPVHNAALNSRLSNNKESSDGTRNEFCPSFETAVADAKGKFRTQAMMNFIKSVPWLNTGTLIIRKKHMTKQYCPYDIK
eukprot:scaffold4468_cov129-Cylindrotheca_fusiformis.AAC.2